MRSVVRQPRFSGRIAIRIGKLSPSYCSADLAVVESEGRFGKLPCTILSGEPNATRMHAICASLYACMADSEDSRGELGLLTFKIVASQGEKCEFPRYRR